MFFHHVSLPIKKLFHFGCLKVNGFVSRWKKLKKFVKPRAFVHGAISFWTRFWFSCLNGFFKTVFIFDRVLRHHFKVAPTTPQLGAAGAVTEDKTVIFSAPTLVGYFWQAVKERSFDNPHFLFWRAVDNNSIEDVKIFLFLPDFRRFLISFETVVRFQITL